MSRVDQFDVSVTIAGRPLGTFDSREGGEYDSEEQKWRPGGMGFPYALGGAKTIENVTVARNFRHERDAALVAFLKAQRGAGDAVVSAQPLDRNKQPFGEPNVWTGTLKRVNYPTHDSNSSEAALLELEITTDGE